MSYIQTHACLCYGQQRTIACHSKNSVLALVFPVFVILMAECKLFIVVLTACVMHLRHSTCILVMTLYLPQFVTWKDNIILQYTTNEVPRNEQSTSITNKIAIAQKYAKHFKLLFPLVRILL